MKLVIYLVLALLMLNFVSAYGGGGFVVPVLNKLAHESTEYEGWQYPVVLDTINKERPGKIRITNNAFEVREIEIYSDKTIRGAGVLVNKVKEIPEDSIIAFEIITNIKEFDEAKITFRVLKSMLEGKGEPYVLHESGKRYIPKKEKGTLQYNYYSVVVKSFSLYTVKADDIPILVGGGGRGMPEDVEGDIDKEYKQLEEGLGRSQKEQGEEPKKLDAGTTIFWLIILGLIVALSMVVYFVLNKHDK